MSISRQAIAHGLRHLPEAAAAAVGKAVARSPFFVCVAAKPRYPTPQSSRTCRTRGSLSHFFCARFDRKRIRDEGTCATAGYCAAPGAAKRLDRFLARFSELMRPVRKGRPQRHFQEAKRRTHAVMATGRARQRWHQEAQKLHGFVAKLPPQLAAFAWD